MKISQKNQYIATLVAMIVASWASVSVYRGYPWPADRDVMKPGDVYFHVGPRLSSSDPWETNTLPASLSFATISDVRGDHVKYAVFGINEGGSIFTYDSTDPKDTFLLIHKRITKRDL